MAKLTPMMAQYKEIKSQYEDCILMYRLGDFYEMFFDDAIAASEILQITLTARGKKGEGDTIPMCGVPFHAVDNYLSKLTKAGKKVAIADQVTAPTGKGIVEREVVRVVTPGTTFDDNILEGNANNYVACIVNSAAKSATWALAYADITTGDFKVTEVDSFKKLEEEFLRISPAECICSRDLSAALTEFFKKTPETHNFSFEYTLNAEAELLKNFELKSLKIFGLEGRDLAVRAAGMLFEYLKETQKTDLKHIQTLQYFESSQFMVMDENLVRNLELFYTSRDAKKEGSLINVLDETMNSMGGRMLRNWLLHPLLSVAAVEERLEKVAVFVNDSTLLRSLRDSLKGIYDIERLLSRLSLGSGNARDLVAMKMSLAQVSELKNLLEGKVDISLELFEDLVALIERAINDEAPATIREGGMIKAGYNAELDDLRAVSGEGKSFIAELQKRESERTGITSLKVKFNKVFGYYIEISKANLAAVPEDYIRKQTLVNAERFITPELKEYEEKVLTAEDRIKELEYELFYEVRMAVVKEIAGIQSLARSLAKIDVLSCFAYLAERNNYAKPSLNEGNVLNIAAARHPVIEKLNFSGDFVPNDCLMNEERNFILLTGPNMGGKSTYLRQVALVVLMAQIGSYVPAASAEIGLVDRIFTRVGASDNLAAGESTFMVEMQEAAYILNQASDRSLVILDEIGRGTSTYDGVSIAWSMTEFIHDKLKCKTLFATHYHELVELAESLDSACNMSVAVRENAEEGVVFLYKIVEGGVDKSYGIEVAKLAGLPLDIVGRARGVLSELESKHIGKTVKVAPNQIGMFREAASLNEKDEGILKALKEVDVENMTPLEALKKLDEMKRRSKS